MQLQLLRRNERAAVPLAGEQFDGADVDNLVVQELVKLRHVLREKALVLPDGVAAERRSQRVAVASDEAQRLLFRRVHGAALAPNALEEPALLVRSAVPGIHPRQARLALP